MKSLPFLLLALTVTQISQAASLRWTYKDDTNAELNHVIEKVNASSGLKLTAKDFLKIEERNLATSKFLMLSQLKQGVPVRGKNIRLWTDLKTGSLIQAEVEVSTLNLKSDMSKVIATLKSTEVAQNTMQVVRTFLKGHEDRLIHDMNVQDQWDNGKLVRTITVKARRGKHIIDIALPSMKVIKSQYREFPQADLEKAAAEEYITLKAQVFPIYEEVESNHEPLNPIPGELKYIKNKVHISKRRDPYEAMKTRRYTEDFYNPLLAETEQGRKEGYWSGTSLRSQAKIIHDDLKLKKNKYRKNGGLILDGKYVTINIHPAAKQKFKDIDFDFRHSTNFYPQWVQGEDGKYEVSPQGGLLGKPILSAYDVLNTKIERLKDHDPVQYINNGFDEIQVYYAVTTLMESLQAMGMTDPDLSTRPFHAYLYDPDISMRDNAYYTDDTINFTTYSPESANAARDNSTIWHELGHGVMDRLMGDHLILADTGGLSEGMADFVAALVIEDKMKGENFPGSNEFRIINHTGFLLTNEVHDDGEAYGGTMKDILNAAIATFGRNGLAKMSDLTMETMRLARNNPGLTANGWFEHMLFADERGSEIRKSGEFKNLITTSLAGRNFSMSGAAPADFILKNGEEVVTDSTLGARENPIRLNMGASEKKTYNLSVQLKSSEFYKFRYPVKVKVEYKKGALQGAIRWDAEDAEQVVILNNENEVAKIPVTASGKCDNINQEDGTCKDYAYVQIFNDGDGAKPSAKKRFYLRIKTAK